nr:mitochondrial GTPase 1-like isoform X2 [Parasteatoda tepidariorum]
MRLPINFVFCRHLSTFRDTFISKYGKPESQAWFPGHMYKGILQMQAKLAVVDCIIEVHDARIPFSGRNPKFYSMLTAVKPHLLVLNKCDKIEYSYRKKIKDRLLKENIQNVLFTNCKANTKSGVDKIIPTVLELIEMSSKYQKGMAADFALMVIGIPNVGKSSIINKLRNIHLKKKKASHVGAVPGITKSVLEKIKISENPKVYLYDTPGVMQPKIDNIEVGLRLALCRTLRDDLIGEALIADYLLYWLNKNKNFR